MIGSVDVKDVKGQEAAIEADRVATTKNIAIQQNLRAQEAIRREIETTTRLQEEHRIKTWELEKLEDRMSSRSKRKAKAEKRAISRVEARLEGILNRKKLVAKETYGRLIDASKFYGGPAHTEVDWRSHNRLVQVRIDYIRALKNKLPGGKYMMMVTGFDRLGGHPLRGIRMGSHSHTAYTPTAQRHSGKYNALCMNFFQNSNKLLLACPSEWSYRPSNCFLFELIAIRGRNNKLDRVVAWGVMPMITANFDIIKGKFKIPLLRGEYDRSIDKYSTIESRISKNIDDWLCNCYVDVKPRARLMGDRTEYQIQSEFSRKFFGDLPSDHEHEDSDSVFEENEEDGKKDTSGDENDEDPEVLKSARKATNEPSMANEIQFQVPVLDEGRENLSFTRVPTFPKLNSNLAGKFVRLSAIRKELGSPRKLSHLAKQAKEGVKNLTKPLEAFANITKQTMKARGDSVSVSSVRSNSVDVFRTNSLDSTTGVGGGHFSSRLDGFMQASYQGPKKSSSGFIMPDFGRFEEHDRDELAKVRDPIALEKLKRKRKAKEELKLLRQYKFSVVNVEGDVPMKLSDVKFRYLKSVLFADISFNRRKTLEFWASIFLMLVACWVRMYAHYFGQFLYLSKSGTPVYMFQAGVFYVDLEYSAATSSLLTETLVVVVGMLTNVLVFLGLMLFTFVTETILDSFPDMFSRFLLGYGIMVFLDPLLILLVDLLRGNWGAGDSFKLYNFFYAQEGTGIAGLGMTIVITAVALAVPLSLLYVYLLHLHMNGRMLDVHHRLLSEEGAYFVPDDLEISMRSLKHIIYKASKWRGLQGTKRECSLTTYTLKDHTDPTFQDVTLHLVIYNILPAKGKKKEERQVYRRFVRKHDGSILELFDNGDDDEYLKMETLKLEQQASWEEHEINELLEQQLREVQDREKVQILDEQDKLDDPRYAKVVDEDGYRK